MSDGTTADALVLGIDGGGSKTIAALADRSGRLVGWSVGGGTNAMDKPGWRDDFSAVLAPLRPDFGRVAGAAVAMAAYGEVVELSDLHDRVVAHELGAIPHRVMNDVDVAHYGAFAGAPGILILAGTGSMAWATDAAGNALRVGGWGDVIGDEGSAYWIGMRAVTLTSRALDGRIEAPRLVDGVFDHLGLDRAAPHDALLRWQSGLDHARSAVAALAPLIGRLASEGEPASLSIIDRAAEHLALHVTTAARRLGVSSFQWSFAGGAFQNRLLREGVTARIGSPPLEPRLPPIGGALLRAARDLDWPVDEAWIGRLAASIENDAIRARNGHTLLP